jgi:glucosamine-6-phosphate deaminase
MVTKDDGPDLIILGIGHNGHIAFNEPGSMDDSITRVVDLAEQTMVSNFGGVGQAGYPTQAITLGLKAILSARHILMLATGSGKRGIIQRAFNMETPPDPDCPASWLKRHPHVTLLTDFEFSSQ